MTKIFLVAALLVATSLQAGREEELDQKEVELAQKEKALSAMQDDVKKALVLLRIQYNLAQKEGALTDQLIKYVQGKIQSYRQEIEPKKSSAQKDL